MSKYISFYIRVGDNFTPLCSYSRSSSVYNCFSKYLSCQFQKIKQLTTKDLLIVKSNIDEEIKSFANRFDKLAEQKRIVCSFTNSIEDKMEAIYAIQESEEELTNEIDELKYAKSFVEFLNTIIEDIAYVDNENATFKLNSNQYVYCGIETPQWPKLSDVM